jgi:hypothetical protein
MAINAITVVGVTLDVAPPRVPTRSTAQDGGNLGWELVGKNWKRAKQEFEQKGTPHRKTLSCARAIHRQASSHGVHEPWHELD